MQHILDKKMPRLGKRGGESFESTISITQLI